MRLDGKRSLILEAQCPAVNNQDVSPRSTFKALRLVDLKPIRNQIVQPQSELLFIGDVFRQ